MKFWTIRHPPVDRQGRCIGQTVIETTMPVVEAAGLVLAEAPVRPTYLYSSDLPRCAELAEEIGKLWNCPVSFTPEIREMNFGDWEGRLYDELSLEDGERWQYWCDNWQTQAPPNGESLEQFTQRVKGWLTQQRFEETTLLVTHAGVLRVLQVLSGGSWEQAMNTSHPYLKWKEHILTES